ncbi:hypothetical protein N7497_006114 [Penicillium chrysogenum]|nr:hypothetical protein N7497_006114 [Penicillium chrysogenum]
MKSREGMEALINDHQSQKLDVLLIQEPSIIAYQTHVNHSAWRLYQPRVVSGSVRYRSLIYVNRNLSTFSHRQMRCNHPDLTAIKVWTADSQILIFSVYIPPSYLPRGTATFWSLSHPGRSSTIDQTVTNSPDLLIKCHLYHDNYGSDHRGTYSEWYLQAQRNLTAKPRKAYDRADWEKIGKDIHGLFERPGELDSPEALDTVVGRLTRTTANAVDKHIPDLKPSPYSKRWFTVDLKAQQKYSRGRFKQRDCYKRSLLHYAAMGNGTDLFIYLLQSKPDVDSPDQWGRTALSWAAEYGLLAVVKVLLEQGANVNASDYEGGAPLTWLIHAGNPEMANLAATEAYLKERGAKEKYGFRDDDLCERGAQGTDCLPCIDGLSEAMRATGRAEKKIWDAFDSVLSPLGGSNEGEKGKPDTVSRNKAIQAVLDFARHHRGFAVVRHEGSLKMGTAVGHDRP